MNKASLFLRSVQKVGSISKKHIRLSSIQPTNIWLPIEPVGVWYAHPNQKKKEVAVDFVFSIQTHIILYSFSERKIIN